MTNGGPTRILIYGVTGSGKSTLALRVSEALQLPYHSVDDLTFEANWKPVPTERQREIIGAIVSGESWILDSAYGQWLDVVLPRAQLIVGLDYPTAFVFARLLRRTIMRMVDGKPICNGNRETLKMALSRDSILLWFFKSYKRKRARIRGWQTQPPCAIARFASPRETEEWLRSLA